MTARYFLEQVPDISKQQAKALKEAIGRAFPGPSSNAQSDKIRQVAFNLRQAPDLLAKHSPDFLVKLSDEQWLQVGHIESRSAEATSRDTLKQLLSIETIDEDKLAANAPMARCHKCGGADITFDSVQLRGADEASSIFFFCQNEKCLFSWILR